MVADVHFTEQRIKDIKINLEGWTCIQATRNVTICVRACKCVVLLRLCIKYVRNAKQLNGINDGADSRNLCWVLRFFLSVRFVISKVTPNQNYLK
jgi:hypothetical protein